MLYPIGIQSFEKIRQGGYVYVDKTDLIYKIAKTGQYYFLTRLDALFARTNYQIQGDCEKEIYTEKIP